MRFDCLVLGAGMVGTSIAAHLAARGRSVALVDRRGPGEETSSGNAGIIDGAALLPVGFPRDLRLLAEVALNLSPLAHFHWRMLPRLAPWLLAYARRSAPHKLERSGRLGWPLVANAQGEHDALAQAAGAGGHYRRTGWLEVFRSPAALDRAARLLPLYKGAGIGVERLDQAGVRTLEPDLTGVVCGGIFWRDVTSVDDPGGVTKAIADLARRRGVEILVGEAQTLREADGGYGVETAAGPVMARDVVVALGPWSMDVLERFGYAFPHAVKRGYHIHLRPADGVDLERPVLDRERGYVITPMRRGIRLTTGAEFADRDAPPTPVQIARCLPFARELLALGESIDATPWLGSRPCFPDMRPIIGPAPHHPHLWIAFGHNHFGFTLGPPTGRLMADLITGAEPFIDPAPFRASRFL